jgi:23S rRNA (pseudouridine1915-N3)-methyltransferase
MKLKLVQYGKTTELWLQEGIQTYLDRLKHYVNFELLTLSASKQTQPEKMKEEEGASLLKLLGPRDVLILWDERGKQYSSAELAQHLEKLENESAGTVWWVSGGAYGFSEAVYQKAKYQLSISSMTFTHQMVRLLIAEQLYRAYTIRKGEKYHH